MYLSIFLFDYGERISLVLAHSTVTEAEITQIGILWMKKHPRWF